MVCIHATTEQNLTSALDYCCIEYLGSAYLGVVLCMCILLYCIYFIDLNSPLYLKALKSLLFGELYIAKVVRAYRLSTH